MILPIFDCLVQANYANLRNSSNQTGCFPPMTLPFEGFRIYSLDRHRLTLPKEVSQLLPWFTAGEGCDALAMPSPHGGIVVLSPEARVWRDSTLSQFEEESVLKPNDLPSEDFTQPLRLRVSWTVTIGSDRRFTLPADAREGGLLPTAPNAKVAVAVVRGAVQIWKSDGLPTVLRDIARL